MATTASQLSLSKTSSTNAIKKRQTEEIKAIRMANNLISNLQILISPFRSMLDTSKVTWLDISFNQIESLDPLIFEHFPNISALYLQANKILRLSEIRKLEKFQRLKSIAIFGNPVEEHKHYRNYVLHYCKSLTNFDMSPVTKSERLMVQYSQPDFHDRFHLSNNDRALSKHDNFINDNCRTKYGWKLIGRRFCNCRWWVMGDGFWMITILLLSRHHLFQIQHTSSCHDLDTAWWELLSLSIFQ